MKNLKMNLYSFTMDDAMGNAEVLLYYKKEKGLNIKI